MENALSLRTGHFRLCHSLLHTIPQAFSSQSVFFRGHFSRYTKIKGAVTRNQLSSFFSWFLRFLTPHFLGQTVKMIIPTPIKKEDEPSSSLAEFGSAVVCPVFRTRCTASRRLMGAFLAIRLEVFATVWSHYVTDLDLPGNLRSNEFGQSAMVLCASLHLKNQEMIYLGQTANSLSLSLMSNTRMPVCKRTNCIHITARIRPHRDSASCLIWVSVAFSQEPQGWSDERVHIQRHIVQYGMASFESPDAFWT